MPGASARDKRKPVEAGDLAIRQLQLIDPHLPPLEVEMVTKRARDRIGLLEDLLEHEVRISRALRSFRIPMNANRLALHCAAFAASDDDSAACQDRDLSVVEDDH